MNRRVEGHAARRRFGQNFLIDADIIGAIVSAIAPRADDTMVEIGPGLGALTGPLLEHLPHLHAVEIDRDLISRLQSRWPTARLTIHAGDALAFDFGRLAGEGRRLRLVGNLPYNISGPLLFHLIDNAHVLHDLHFMLQKEVVDRMVAAPGTADRGRLSVMLQYHFYIERLFTVPPESFAPAPKVDSAIVRLIPWHGPAGGTVAQPVARDNALFARLTASAFAQRRKMLRNTLRGLADSALLEAAGIAPTARAEELEVADFVRLANLLTTRDGR